MVKQVKSRRAPAKRSPEFNARELWLASLGAASLTRKQGIKLYGVMVDEGRGLQSRVSDVVNSVGEQVNGTIDTVKARIEEVIAPVRARFDGVIGPVRERAEATYIVIKDEIQTRLQPVLVKFGAVKPKPRAAAKRVAKARPTGKASKRAVRRVRKAA